MIDDVRLFIATPAYGGLVTTNYLQALLREKENLERQGATVVVDTISNESLITRARNGLASRFLAARTGDGRVFSHLMFVDADIGYPVGSIERLLRFGEPLVAASYPLKSIDWDALVAQLRAGGPPPGDPRALESLASAFAFVASMPAEIRHDCMEVERIGTGFMCIERRVFEDMIRAFPDLAYANDVPGYEVVFHGDTWTLAPPLAFHAFFETAIDPRTRTYLSEDYAFCDRWRSLGGRVWMICAPRITHTGTYTFRGSVALSLEASGLLTR